jgi:hypothetical protein
MAMAEEVDAAFWATVEVPDLWKDAAACPWRDRLVPMAAERAAPLHGQVYWPNAAVRAELLAARAAAARPVASVSEAPKQKLSKRKQEATSADAPTQELEADAILITEHEKRERSKKRRKAVAEGHPP